MTDERSEQIRRSLIPAPGRPEPLYCPEKNFCLIWSAKSACTTVLLWYLAHRDLLKEQKELSDWPHDYRERVLRVSPDYLAAIREADIDSIRWVRTIRPPLKRAVSSYIHAITKRSDDARISAYLGRDLGESPGFSFREYVDWLSASGTGNDIHEMPQRQRLEELVDPHVIVVNGDGLWDDLERFEIANDIEPISAENRELLMSEVARINTFHHSAKAPMTDAPDIVFSATPSPKAWPTYSDMLDSDITEKLEHVYRLDLEAYRDFLV